MARGHRPTSIDPILRECCVSLKKKYPLGNSTEFLQRHPSVHSNKNSMKRLFFHLPFHPREVSRAKIQEYYNRSCNLPDEYGDSFKDGCPNNQGHSMKIEQLTVAYSRPKNLRDLLSPTTLIPPPNSTVTSIYNQL